MPLSPGVGKLGVGRSDGYPFDDGRKPLGGYPPVTGGRSVPTPPPPVLADGYPSEVLLTPVPVWKPLVENPPGDGRPDVMMVELGKGGLGLVDGKVGGCGGR